MRYCIKSYTPFVI